MRAARWRQEEDEVDVERREPARVLGIHGPVLLKPDTEVTNRIREISLLARGAQDDVNYGNWLQLRRKLRGILYLAHEAATWRKNGGAS
jgi:hypothetical protein